MDRVSARKCVGTVGLALVTACGTAAQPAAPSAVSQNVAPPRRVVVLGDSLAVSPSAAEGFPAELQRFAAAAELSWTFVNAGVRGDTTAGGLHRIESLLSNDVGILILALGSNDGLRGVPIATIEQNLSSIIELARARGIRVLLCGLETLPTNGFDYAIAFHNLFPRLRDRYDLPLVPFLLAGVVLVPDLNGPDGFHPNAAGARRIAETVWPHLETLLRSGPAMLTGASARVRR
jgi:acyl-CoA thioesterase-1